MRFLPIIRQPGEGRLEKLSDLFQISLLEENADDFFVSPAEFVDSKFGQLVNFLNEKFGIIIAFARRALYHRKIELGIYSNKSEFDDKVIIEETGRSKLFVNLDASDWFLSNTLNSDMESYYFTSMEAVKGVLLSPEDDEELSPEEIVLFDNENRPLK